MGIFQEEKEKEVMSVSGGIVNEVRYENIMAVYPVMEDGHRTPYINVEIADPSGEVNLRRGSKVTLDVNEPDQIAGIRTVEAVTESHRGHLLVKVKACSKLICRARSYNSTTGRLYFGEVNTFTEQGGVATFIAKTDAGKVIMYAVGGFIIALGAWALLTGD